MAAPFPSAALPCPRCESMQTVVVSDRFGSRVHFCGECEHTWTVQKKT